MINLIPNRVNLKELGKKLGVKFKNQRLLGLALTHSSAQLKTEDGAALNNERLEFFGDAVLKLAVSEFFYLNYSRFSEGELTKVRATVVSDFTLAQVARQLSLGDFIILGPHELKTREFNRPSILAAALEAVFAAIYLDRGFPTAKKIIIKLLGDRIEAAINFQHTVDFKSKLQEEVQKIGWSLPVYRVLAEKGPEHQKIFYVEVTIGEGARQLKATGKGKTKKTAQQWAARAVLEKYSL